MTFVRDVAPARYSGILPFSMAMVLAATACAGRLQPLAGVMSSVPLPRMVLPAGHRKVTFEWSFEDPDLGSARGDGAAQVAAPDSVRLDFFLAGGLGGGAAILIDDSLQAPAVSMVRRLIPPPPMLWAALGRSALPRTVDTVVHADGPAIWADLGRPAQWRVTFHGDTIVHLERVADGRTAESVERLPSGAVQYHNLGAHRTLTLSNIRVLEVSGFDPSIWHFTP